MQPLAISSKVGKAYNAAGSTPYSAAAVTNLINAHGGYKLIDFRFDLINSNDLSYKGDITPYVVNAAIQHDSTRPVHRTCHLVMADTSASQTVTVQGTTITEANIDYNHDYVKPWCLVGVPGTSDWLHFALGVFRFTRPTAIMPGYAVQRQADMADLTHIVQQMAATSNSIGAPFPLPAGVALIDIVYHLLTNPAGAAGTGTAYDIPTGTPSLANIPGLGIPTARVGTTQYPWPTNTAIDAQSIQNYTFSEGTSYLDMMNQMLYWCSCENLAVDESGSYYTRARPFDGNYNGYAVQYTYDSTVDSIIDFGGSEDLDLDALANIVQVVVEDPSRVTFYAVAQNTNAASPISLTNHPPVVKTVRDSGVPTATATNWAQNYANIMLREASFLVDTVSITTSVNPAHQDRDVCALNIYQNFVAAGSPQNWPIVVGASTPNTNTVPGQPAPGITSSEKFLELGWEIKIQPALPNTGKATGGSGVTTGLEPQHTKMGHVMSHRFQRTTSLQ